MKEFRVILLLISSLIAARVMSESAACPLSMLELCGESLIVLVLFILSSYFVDFLFSSYDQNDKKRKVIYAILAIPYISLFLFVFWEFIKSVSMVTVEYMVSVNIIYSLIIYLVMYWLNNRGFVKRLNPIFMVTMLFSFVIFLLL